LVAKWLRVTEPPEEPKKVPAIPVNSEIKVITLNNESAVIGKKIVDLHFPVSVNIISIKRNGKYMLPTGADNLESGDRLLLLSDNEQELTSVLDLLGKKQITPVRVLHLNSVCILQKVFLPAEKIFH
jgi:cell volume regulation protein A